ncbi:trypco2 family protein [Streptomyces sp. NPDC058001]|uniref:trypco2 family protein n=1 Tax=Streptomyces sp. NPDC058001 TaxID=3346300 RepID=UPI0036ED86D7
MIELAEMIGQLRAELARAMVAAEGEELRFGLGTVELEAEFVVERSAGGEGRVRFWVVEAGASGQVGTSATHRVTLSLEPLLRDSDARPWVSGAEAAGER